jgi:hypothetical protein
MATIARNALTKWMISAIDDEASHIHASKL